MAPAADRRGKAVLTPSDSIAVTGTGLGAAPAPAGRDPALAPAVGTAVLVMLIIQAGLVLKGNAPVLNGVLIDPDGYMRLARVEHLWLTGAWFDPVFPRIGPPEGLALHWTRPFDVILLVISTVAQPFTSSFDQALLFAGIIVSPLIAALGGREAVTETFRLFSVKYILIQVGCGTN